MQRDLSGSSAKRTIGVALAHGYLAVEQTLIGLRRIDLDERAAREKVDATPETLTEAYQTILRAVGLEDPYEKLREHSRGRSLRLEDLHQWAKGLDIDAATKRRLLQLRPSNYVGLSAELCRRVVADARSWLAT
ncbi:MAG: adenylosuccinate lyase, partial [bacterium]